ncbi:MAG: hypothetical protein ACK47B_22295 [Armatimonadota bacterium]
MAELFKTIGSTVLRVRCDDHLLRQAQGVLDSAATFAHTENGLSPGVTIQFGWSLLMLWPDGDLLAICEPDFDGDALRAFRDDVSCTLEVVTLQTQFLRQLGIEAGSLRFDEKVVFKRGALSECRIYAERQASAPGDSGWYVGPADDTTPPTTEALTACRVYELLRLRPSLLPALALPEGFLVVFNGDAVEAVLDPGNENRWPGDAGMWQSAPFS